MTKMTKRGVDDLGHHPFRPVWLLVGQRIRARRVQRGHKVHCVADELSISPTLYVGYESGENQVPALVLSQLAEFLGVPVLWFFQDASSPEEDDGSSVCDQSAPTYRIATSEERVDALAESFRNLDLEGQQQLLAMAAALSRSNGKEK